MSDASSYAVSVPAGRRHTQRREVEIDTTATYSFPFARNRWFTGMGILVQGSLMIAVGGFLLSQVVSTPNLRVQMTIIATLLIAGGLALAYRSLADFFGSVSIGPQGFKARFGLRGFSLDWSDIEAWRVNEVATQFPELHAVELWESMDAPPRTVPGSYLSVDEQHRVRHLLAAFATGREET